MTTIKHFTLTAAALTALTLPTSAINIVLDYSSSTNSFFDTGTTNGAAARATLAQAAADISNAITTNLSAVNASSLTFTGTNGGATINLDANIGYTNPQTGASVTLNNLNLAENEFRIYVGARSLSGSTLGTGGPGSRGWGASGSSSGGGSFATAQDIAEADFNGTLSRGGVVLDTIITTTYQGPLELNFAPLIGNLWFDNDASTTWNYDHTVLPGSGQNDLYSVALHEILHSLGVGIAYSDTTYDTSWSLQANGNDWIGSEVNAITSGINILESDGAHIASGIMSTRISDGTPQEVVMDPTITTGTRKELTELDLAFLRDMGYETIPEPSSSLLLGLGSFALLIRRRK